MALGDLWGQPRLTRWVAPDEWQVPVESLVRLRSCAWALNQLLAHMDEHEEWGAEDGAAPFWVDRDHLRDARAASRALTYADLSVGPGWEDAARVARGEPPVEPETWSGHLDAQRALVAVPVEEDADDR